MEDSIASDAKVADKQDASAVVAADAATSVPLPSAAARERNVILDTLRIIAISFIVFHHFVINNVGVDGTVFSSVEVNPVTDAFLPLFLGSEFIDCFLIIGVNLFFLLSGYFSIKLRPSKIVVLLLKTYVYFVLGELIAYAAGYSAYTTVADAVTACLLSPSKYWFILVYFALCVLAPLLNTFAEKLKGGQITFFVFVSVLFCCFIGFISDFWTSYLGTNEGYSPLWAAVVYVYGRLICLHGFGKSRKPIFWFAVFMIATLLNYTVVALLTAVARNGAWAWHMYGYNNPLIALSSVAFFLAFCTMKPVPAGSKGGKFASAVAAHSLGVYLIHCNNPAVSPYRAFLIDLCAADTLWLQYVLLVPNVLIVFVGAVAIDFVFDLVTKRVFNAIGRAAERFILFLYRAIASLIQRLFKAKSDAAV